jgi:hypothetical protein
MRHALVLLLACLPLTGQSDWKPLFDGKSLEGWQATAFPRHPAPKVEGGAIMLPHGAPLTGVTWTGAELPKFGYELRFEAQRVQGGDFFASVTFPAGNSHATFVTGGWGGDIVGISSIDGWDASENETRKYFTFEPGKWYTFRIRVKADQIEAWIGDKQVVDVNIAGREVGLRPGDTKLTAPLGFMSYNTTGAIRKIEIRTIR